MTAEIARKQSLVIRPLPRRHKQLPDGGRAFFKCLEKWSHLHSNKIGETCFNIFAEDTNQQKEIGEKENKPRSEVIVLI